MQLNEIPWLRVILYLLAIVCAVAAPFLTVWNAEYGAACVTASAVLTTAAGTSALTNLSPKKISTTAIVPITSSNEVSSETELALTALYANTIDNSPVLDYLNEDDEDSNRPVENADGSLPGDDFSEDR